jgi:hypothetical protein
MAPSNNTLSPTDLNNAADAIKLVLEQHGIPSSI